MAELTVRTAEPDEYQDIADLAVALCATPEHHCIHTWAGEESASLCADWRALHTAGELVFVGDDSELTGYLYAVMEDDPDRGGIEFVAVRPDDRGQGHGRCLLLAALRWLFAEKGVSHVILNVRDELTHARSLYESVGFVLQYSGLALYVEEE